jgi:hypothetical protein
MQQAKFELAVTPPHMQQPEKQVNVRIVILFSPTIVLEVIFDSYRCLRAHSDVGMLTVPSSLCFERIASHLLDLYNSINI